MGLAWLLAACHGNPTGCSDGVSRASDINVCNDGVDSDCNGSDQWGCEVDVAQVGFKTVVCDGEGEAIDGAGDVNGDGDDDFILDVCANTLVEYGSPNPSSDDPPFSWGGYGSDDTISWIGGANAGVGDINGDGFADLLIAGYVAGPTSSDSAWGAFAVLGGPDVEHTYLSQAAVASFVGQPGDWTGRAWPGPAM